MTKATLQPPSKFLFARKIRDLLPGEIGYAVPWAFNPDTCDLNEDFVMHYKPFGAFQLAVKRSSDGSFVVALHPGSSSEYQEMIYGKYLSATKV